MTTAILNAIDTHANKGIAREHNLCAYMGIVRVHHDSTDYRTSSDICVNDRHISVKASGFTLMSGNMCEGQTTFEGIWEVYTRNTHSNEWAYVTEDNTAYFMNMSEFSDFIHTFGRVEAESAKNGGAMKIRCKKESKKMLQWLEARV